MEAKSWQETVMDSAKLLTIAIKVLGTNDSIRPIMPKRGELIQEAMEQTALAQAKISFEVGRKSRDAEIAEAKKEGFVEGG